METPNPMPAIAPVLSREDEPLECQESESDGESFFESADLPLLPMPIPVPVESASAVATADAAAAVVGVVGKLEAGVELAEAVGEDTELGGSVDGTELSLLPGSAVVACSLDVLDGATTRGVFGVADEPMESEVGGMEQGLGEHDGDDEDLGFQGSGEPSAGLRATGVLADEDTALNSKRASGVPQHCAFSSAYPQQNLAVRPKVWFW